MISNAFQIIGFVVIFVSTIAITPKLSKWENALLVNLGFALMTGCIGWIQKGFENFLILSVFLLIVSLICFVRVIKE